MTALAQENDHIRKLIAARDREAEQRRNIADALAKAYGETERMREVFINHRRHRAGPSSTRGCWRAFHPEGRSGKAVTPRDY